VLNPHVCRRGIKPVESKRRVVCDLLLRLQVSGGARGVQAHLSRAQQIQQLCQAALHERDTILDLQGQR
jgi:GH35 family endo-1,4-beta-xylanase